ncbi:MAG: starch-binding protein [Bacteroidales bacterium]|nr:starch-binding protein [Bacteroidales bacterium]
MSYLKIYSMRRSFKGLLSLMCASVFAAACIEETAPVEPEVNEETVVFTASIDDADTKTILNGTATEWVAGDGISIHNGTKAFTFKAKSAGKNTEFTYTGNDFSGNRFLAVYPAGTYTADLNAKTVTANIPVWQQAQKGTWHSPAAVGVAYSETNALAFKNVTALLKFRVNTDKVTHVVFCGNSNEGLTGNIKVSLTSAGPSVEVLPTEIIKDKEKISDLGTWVEIYAYHDDQHKYFEKNQDYYIAVAPQVFNSGVSAKIRIDDGDEIQVKKTTSKVTLDAGTIYDLGTFEYTAPPAPEWAIPGAYNGWSTYAEMTEQGDFFVARNVTKLDSKDNGFKIMNNGSWLGFTGAVAVNTWNVLGGDVNIYVTGATAEASYDVYVYPAKRMFYVTAAGSAAPAVPNVEMYRFYVQNNVGWETLNFYAWGGYTTAGWPGDKMTKEASVGDYGVCKYVEIPKGTEVVNLIINNGTKQTKDIVVKSSSKVNKLSNGDYVYVLEAADVK